jgi:hypothetical protein
MADQVHVLLRLLGELKQHGKIGLAGEDLALRPGVGLPIADEVWGEHAPVGLERLDQRQPFLVRGRAAMGDDDERAFAPVEIGDLNAVGLEALHGHRFF